MKTLTTHIIALLIIVLFSFGCGQSSKKAKDTTATTSVKTKVSPTIQSKKNPNPSGNSNDPKNGSDNPSEEVTPESDIVDVCGNSTFDLMANINQSVDRLEGTPYSQELKNDCSGIFHQVLDGMRDQCPNAVLPTINEARSSRGIAGWYYKNEDLTIIRNPAKQGDLIKPGVALFYGHARRASLYNYKTMTIDTLTARGTGINHVAIVTEVKRDENGVLQSYVIFHGKNKGKPAGTTTSRLSYPNHPELPVYGNWGEPWLAIADVMVAK